MISASILSLVLAVITSSGDSVIAREVKANAPTADSSASVAGAEPPRGTPLIPPHEAEHKAVIEIGGAAEWSSSDYTSSGGMTVAAEVTPIENWLELEAGVTALASGHQRELSFDFLFKKPWQLTRTAEFMAGFGPELSHTSGTAGTADDGTRLSTEAVLDFMFWPRPNIGWYFEPSYATSGGKSGERSLGMTGGLLIGIP